MEIDGHVLFQLRFNRSAIVDEPVDVVNEIHTKLMESLDYFVLYHAAREFSSQNKEHYHIIFSCSAENASSRLTSNKRLKEIISHAIKPLLLPTVKSHEWCVKEYSKAQFKSGESWLFYIGYCCKDQDPVPGFEYSDSIGALRCYNEIKKNKGNDEYFMEYIKKHLSPDSTREQFVEIIVDWYTQFPKSTSPLIISQQYWKALAIINPDKFRSDMSSSVLSILSK